MVGRRCAGADLMLKAGEGGMRAPSDEEWQALLARKTWPGGYAVTSTGVYCRFGCSARAPLRRNVQVFGDRAEAVAAGFRACLRCRPDGDNA